MALSEQDQRRLESFLEKVREYSNSFLGYPAARDFDFSMFKDYLHYPTLQNC